MNAHPILTALAVIGGYLLLCVTLAMAAIALIVRGEHGEPDERNGSDQ